MHERFDVAFLPAVQAEIAQVLDDTEAEYGLRQVGAYEELIRLALRDLRENAPNIGLPCPQACPGARLYRIERRGQHAAHMFLYRVRGDLVEIGAFLHMRMDPSRRAPMEWDG
ncbi:MAG: type II toxin-antitoxin system RelE/ParE family toxin [Myxococcales bacterium]|nr:type II toxin-antitoxin system RelE/ParE family toxin [Myxococcales bacterium]